MSDVSVDRPRRSPTRRDIDVTFDCRSDTPPGKDPDARSPTLHRYHLQLWNKPLPNGERFELLDARPKGYLRHRSALGEFVLSSDSVIPSFRKERRLAGTLAAIPAEEQATFMAATYTIGAMMVFPSNVVDRRMTINGARGCHPRIKDRFDLTIECVRRHYAGDRSPLTETLARYARFFELFETFRGYVEFFLLQDVVDADGATVRFHLPFAGFDDSPVPADRDAYLAYRRRAAQFIEARNQRIRAWVREPPAP